jgi:ribonuclease D
VPVFDTQLAAPLLGHAEQIGYANLVHAILDVRLHKAHSRTDWSRRPLTPAQLRYAGDDVLYLGRIYQRILADLELGGRMEWLKESHARLIDPEQYRQTPERAWRRLKGVDRLDARQQSAAQRLAAWREATAQSENRPRGWILSDEILLVLARMLPRSSDDLERVRNLSDAVRRRHGATLLRHIAEALESPLPVTGERPAGHREELSEEQEAIVDGMMAVLRLCAADHGVHPSAVASRRDLERLVRGEHDLDLLQGWRRQIAGDRLREFADGRRALVVRAGVLGLEPA